MPPQRPTLINKLISLPRMGGLVADAHDAWLRAKFYRSYELKTAPARRAFEAEKVTLKNAQRRVLTDLVRCGIARVHFDELFCEGQLWESLSSTINQWLNSKEVKDKERAYLQGEQNQSKWKDYIVRLYGKEQVITTKSPLLRLGIQPQILNIVNSYLGMMSKLIYLDVWNSLPSLAERPLNGSQRWHRDPEDIKLVKVFLYFTDVGLNDGPLHYVLTSRKGEKYGHLWPQKVPKGSVPPAEALESVVPRSDWEVCAYPAGTFIFADTSGFHMGGRATESQRVLATWAYVTPGSLWPRSFKCNPETIASDLPSAAASALSDQ